MSEQQTNTTVEQQTDQVPQASGPVDIIDAAVAAMGDEAGPSDGEGAGSPSGSANTNVEPDTKQDDAAKAKPVPEDTEKSTDSAIPKSWEAVVRKEKQLREEREALKAEREALDRIKNTETTRFDEAAKRFDEEMLADPLTTLQRRYGLTLNDLADRALNDGKPGSQEAARRQAGDAGSKVEQLEQKIQTLAQIIEQQNHERLRGQYRSEVEGLLADERYQLLGARKGAADAIMDRASQLAREGTYVSPQDIVERIHSEYREDLSHQVSHSAVIKELEARGYKITAPSNGNGNGKSQSPKDKTRITNDLNATPPPRPPREAALMSEDELINEAVRQMDLST